MGIPIHAQDKYQNLTIGQRPLKDLLSTLLSFVCYVCQIGATPTTSMKELGRLSVPLPTSLCHLEFKGNDYFHM
jgi:hypothetical protein